MSIDNLMSPHIAFDQDMLARAIKAIDINHPSLADYDSWCALSRAIKAACGGNAAFYTEHVWPWLAQHPEYSGQEDVMLAKWYSFRDSRLGAPSSSTGGPPASASWTVSSQKRAKSSGPSCLKTEGDRRKVDPWTYPENWSMPGNTLVKVKNCLVGEVAAS